jgi:two-component system, OmpR family, sensor histidine kinase VicK
MRLLTEAALERGVKIRLLVGKDGLVVTEIEKLRRSLETIDIQPLETALQTMLLVIVVDKRLSLSIELRDDVEDLYDAIGLTTYSNSESTVLTYASIFENLWIQRELRKGRKGTTSQTR